METKKTSFLFEKQNYIILLTGIAVIGIGFLLMSGGNSEDPNVFNYDVFSFRRIRLAPTVIFIGFAVCIYSIFYTPKNLKNETTDKKQ